MKDDCRDSVMDRNLSLCSAEKEGEHFVTITRVDALSIIQVRRAAAPDKRPIQLQEEAGRGSPDGHENGADEQSAPLARLRDEAVRLRRRRLRRVRSAAPRRLRVEVLWILSVQRFLSRRYALLAPFVDGPPVVANRYRVPSRRLSLLNMRKPPLDRCPESTCPRGPIWRMALHFKCKCIRKRDQRARLPPRPGEEDERGFQPVGDGTLLILHAECLRFRFTRLMGAALIEQIEIRSFIRDSEGWRDRLFYHARMPTKRIVSPSRLLAYFLLQSRKVGSLRSWKMRRMS